MDWKKANQQIAKDYESQCCKLAMEPNKAICSCFEKRDSQVSLVFKGNDKLNFTKRMSDKDLIILCNIMENYKDLIKHIDLSYNDISNNGCVQLAKLIARMPIPTHPLECPCLETLNLQGNKIESQGAQSLAEALRESYTICYLNLNHNKYPHPIPPLSASRPKAPCSSSSCSSRTKASSSSTSATTGSTTTASS